jgi:acyl-CoA synthetase (AMP-forming)/AMP-acid ligase II
LSVSHYQRNTAADRILAALPLSFDYGFSQVTVAFAVGACAVLANFALPAALLQEAQTERITGLAGAPTMWMHLAAMEWPAAVARNLRYVTNSGGAMPAAVLARLRAALPTTQVYCMYGLTEAFRSTYLDPAELDRRPGSIGKAIPGQEVFVLRPDGSECAAGEVGELVHRGSLVTLGYWNDPIKTALRFRPLPPKLPQIPRSEWAVWSGDLARKDAEGYLYFVSRGDHLIKSSGYRISPTEVEEAVAEVPGVVESAAVGLADESLGQRVAVAIVAAAGSAAGELAEAVRQHCRVQLPSYMVPAEIHVLDSLPRNVNGKCDRGVLAVQLAELAPRAREA